jgi:glutamyl-tRNA synthetase
LFSAFGFACQQYGHIPSINKLDVGGGKRKLSKRKDPEANVLFYDKIGYPEDAVIEYLLNLANSDFEDWRKNNQDKPHTEFVLDLKRFSNASGPLFDEVKLKNISRDVVARMSADEVYAKVVEWSSRHDSLFCASLKSDRGIWIKILSIERGGVKQRKDISAWSDVKNLYSYVDQAGFLLPKWDEFQSALDLDEIKMALSQFRLVYSADDTTECWMQKVRDVAQIFGLAPDIKTFKKNKDQYRGHVGEISQIIRYAITGKTQTPDLYQIMKVLGNDECKRRLA